MTAAAAFVRITHLISPAKLFASKKVDCEAECFNFTT